MLLSIEGQEKSGKTALAYSAPLPIVGFQFDIGWKRSLYGPVYDSLFADLDIHSVNLNRLQPPPKPATPSWEGHDITIYDLPQPIQLDTRNVKGYLDLWDYFIALLGMAASDSNVKTIVIDTATIARSVRASAHLEELNQNKKAGEAARKQLLQIEYGPINQAFENIYTIFASLNKHLITVHHLRDKYVPQNVRGEMTQVPNGELELDGWNKTYRFVDVAVRNIYNSYNFTFESDIVVCGENPALVGTKLTSMNWNSLVDLISASLEGRVSYERR